MFWKFFSFKKTPIQIHAIRNYEKFHSRFFQVAQQKATCFKSVSVWAVLYTSLDYWQETLKILHLKSEKKNKQGRHSEREREGWEKAFLVEQAKPVWLSSETYPLLGWKSAGKEKEGRETRGRKVGGFVTYASKVSQPCRTLHRSVHCFTRFFYRLNWTERDSEEQTQVNKTTPWT